jgi:hypothetical protein
MKTKAVLLATVSLVVVALPIVPALSNADRAKDTHKYTIGVEGTQDVKLRMLLVAKPSARAAPTRESKIVTVPFETTFEASSFYVWFDTLDGGESGKDGDRIMAMYKIGGELQGGGFGGTLKGEKKKTFGFGNL